MANLGPYFRLEVCRESQVGVRDSRGFGAVAGLDMSQLTSQIGSEFARCSQLGSFAIDFKSVFAGPSGVQNGCRRARQRRSCYLYRQKRRL